MNFLQIIFRLLARLFGGQAADAEPVRPSTPPVKPQDPPAPPVPASPVEAETPVPAPAEESASQTAPEPEPIAPDPEPSAPDLSTEPVNSEPVEAEVAPAQVWPPAPGSDLLVQEEVMSGKTYVRVNDGTIEGRFQKVSMKKGAWTGLAVRGEHTIAGFLEKHAAMLGELNVSDSALNVMKAVSENEGNLEAINAYDGAFLSFGIFQWTLGTKDNAGELAALMKKVKTFYPEAFEQYFGRFGLDIDERETTSAWGFLTLNGLRVQKRADKEAFRGPEWVYRFWRAGRDPRVQAAQIEHALSRLKHFYWREKAHGFPLSDIVTSEYGVGLILDNHVNLPALPRVCLRLAMEKTGLKDPRIWTTEEEKSVLDAYLEFRAGRVEINGAHFGPMFDAHKRARTTARYVEKRIISDQRGSFQYERSLSRGLGGFGVPEPAGYIADDYPEIPMGEQETEAPEE